MASSSDDFDRLMQRVSAGSQPAAQELHDLFHEQLLRAVRRKLPRVLRPKYDSQDFVQEAWTTFWEKHLQRYSFRHPGALAALLCRTAENRVVDAVRKGFGLKKDVNKEVELDAVMENYPQALLSPTPTPSRALMCDEEWQRFVSKQPPVFRRMLILHRQGAGAQDMADELGFTRRTVDRMLAKLLEQYHKESRT